MKHVDHSKLIDDLGGPSALASLFGISSQAISKWRLRGIPDDKLMRLAVIAEKNGISSRKALFQDTWQLLWPELSEHI